jgi:hypothetical protein
LIKFVKINLMKYLTLADFGSKITKENLDVVISSTEGFISDTELDVIQEISSYLSSRYDTAKIFGTYETFEAATTYPIDTLLFLTAKPRDVAKSYAVNDLAADETSVYKAIAAGTNQSFTDATKWIKIGALNSFCKVKTAEQAGILTNANEYTQGDPRNALIKRYAVDIVLYELHSRINPRNIPEFRIQRRDDAISWLKAVQDPRNNINADFLPSIDFGPSKGNDMSWGGRTKQVNKY